MRRVVSVCLGALACLLFVGPWASIAQEDPGPSPTTTAPPVIYTTTSAPAPATTTTTAGSTATTARPNATTTTLRNGGRPIPPPPAGPTQTLVPDLLGTPLEIPTSTTSSTVEPLVPFDTGSLPTNVTTPISTSSDSPSGLTLVLAAIAWLASFGGLLVYAEERRAAGWKHLAR